MRKEKYFELDAVLEGYLGENGSVRFASPVGVLTPANFMAWVREMERLPSKKKTWFNELLAARGCKSRIV